MTDYQTFIVVQEIAFQNASMTKNNALTKTYLNQFNRHVVAFLKEGDYSNSFRQPKQEKKKKTDSKIVEILVHVENEALSYISLLISSYFDSPIYRRL